jgi:hypothetical protein
MGGTIMKLRGVFLIVGIMSCVTVNVVSSAWIRSEEDKASTEDVIVQNFMESFCRAEFEGEEKGTGIRLHTVKYSKKRYSEEKKTDPDFEGKVIYLKSSSLYVVGSYRVVAVEVKNNRAIATVEYYRLARTKGGRTLNRQLIPDCNERDIVTYNLIYQNKKWWIYDPPLPRVSPEAMIDEFKENLKIMGDDYLVRPGLSEVQREGYRKLQNDLKILEGLRTYCEHEQTK